MPPAADSRAATTALPMPPDDGGALARRPAPEPEPSAPAHQQTPARFRRPSRRHPLVQWPGTGVLLSLTVAIKINAGLVALGPAWALRRTPRKLALVAGTALATAATAYALAGPHAFDRVSQATKSISLATPWSLVRTWLQTALGSGGYRSWIQAGSLLLLLALAWLLTRALHAPYATPRPTPGTDPPPPANTPLTPTPATNTDGPGEVSGERQGHPLTNTDRPGETSALAGTGAAIHADRAGAASEQSAAACPTGHEDAPSHALRATFAISGRARTPDLAAAGVSAIVVTAWLFAAPYALPWYDGLAFALLALLPATPLDGFLAARLSLLSLAYLPAREAGRPPDLDWLVNVVRAQIVPWALLVLTAALAWWAWHASRRSP